MVQSRFSFLGIFLISILLSCKSKEPVVENKEPQRASENLSTPMSGFKAGISNLLPLITSPNDFIKQENRNSLLNTIEQLILNVRSLNHSPVISSIDPSLNYISKELESDLENSLMSVRLQRLDYARYRLMHIVSYCVECHTRTNLGPSFHSENFEKRLVELKPLQRAEFLISIRDFDKALEELEKATKENGVETNYFDLDRAIRYSLAISIKYKRSADLSSKIIQKVSAGGRLPFYLRHNVAAWNEAIKDWQTEKPTIIDLDYVDRLMEKAKKAQFGFSDRGGDIYYLRAISILHQILEQQISKAEGAEKNETLGKIFFYLGTCYEATRDLAVWQLHEKYFETCIHKSPGTVWAEKCYLQYKESLEVGYSGSNGLDIPTDVQKKIEELKSLSEIKTDVKKQ